MVVLILLIWWCTYSGRRGRTDPSATRAPPVARAERRICAWVRVRRTLYIPHQRGACTTLTQAPYGETVTQTPALGTVWVYSIVKLDLAWACLSLVLTFAYVSYAGLHLLL